MYNVFEQYNNMYHYINIKKKGMKGYIRNFNSEEMGTKEYCEGRLTLFFTILSTV